MQFIEDSFEAERYKWNDYHSPSKLPKISTASENGIAWIDATGEIVMHSQSPDKISPKLKTELLWALESENVKSVVLRIDSPGGSALASELIWKAIHDLNAQKPVIVSMGGVAASGGYYLASAAKKIFASRTTITGSIGVIGMIPWLQDSTNKYGISFHTITSNNRSSLLNPGKTLSRQDREKIQSSINQTYSTFLERVASGRSMDKDNVHKLAQGRVWTGQQALDHGLIDAIGGAGEALNEAKVLAGWSESDRVPILRWTPDFDSIADCLMESPNPMRCFPVQQSRSSSILEKLEHSLEAIDELGLDPIQARVPNFAIW